MTPGIRQTMHVASALSALLVACAKAPDQHQLSAVDQLITATDGAALTLNELDRSRYEEAVSMLTSDSAAYAWRFSDTLRPEEARVLGSQWTTLRGASTMARDHERVLAELIASAERLRALRNDLLSGAMDAARAASIIADEQKHHTEVSAGVLVVIDNYRALQQAWDRRDSVNLLFADTTAS